MLILPKPGEYRRKAEELETQAKRAATCVQRRACEAAFRSTNLPNLSWNSCIGAITACRSAPAGSLLAVSRRRRNVFIKSMISSEFRWGNMASPICACGSATCLSATAPTDLVGMQTNSGREYWFKKWTVALTNHCWSPKPAARRRR